MRLLQRKQMGPVEIVLTAALCLISVGTLAAYDAEEVLDATGVKGGLVVHVGCGDGTLTARLRANDRYLVQGLDTDAANVEKARARIRALGIYGKVSVDRFDGSRLPYAENMVNLLLSEDLGAVSMDEVTRVLVPNGVAYLRVAGKWKKIV